MAELIKYFIKSPVLMTIIAKICSEELTLINLSKD